MLSLLEMNHINFILKSDIKRITNKIQILESDSKIKGLEKELEFIKKYQAILQYEINKIQKEGAGK